MIERIWDKFLTERFKAVFAAGGFEARGGFGPRTLGQCVYFNQCRPPQIEAARCRQAA